MLKSTQQSTDENEELAQECDLYEGGCPFARKLVQLKEEVDALNFLVNQDELTGLFNYRHFLTSIDLEMERARRSGHPVALIMMDLDHFKKLNDTWGHGVGNAVLQHAARIVRNTLRRLDVPCRYGGEEFAIILPNTNLHAAIKLAKRLRINIEDSALTLEDKQVVHITASFGVDAFYPIDPDNIAQFVARTDAWLYQAKAEGRNLVRHAEDREETHVSKEERDFLLGDF